VRDPGLAAAVERLVDGALGVVAGERVLIVHDVAHDLIAELAVDAVRMARAEAITIRLEDHAARPVAHLPPIVTAAIKDAQVSLLCIDMIGGELSMRSEMVKQAADAGLRHGHMVGVARASMIAGLSVDPRRIAEKSRALQVRLGPSSRIAVRSAAGTDLVITLSERTRWLDYGAVVLRGKRVNLPGGELVTSPDDVNGTYVADGTLGDADGALTQRLAEAPLTLRFKSSRVVDVACPKSPSLAALVTSRIARAANLDRVGLIGFGVNVGLTEPHGDVFSDQKIPGVHVSLGETFPAQTGATWTSQSWIALTSGNQDLDVDGNAVMRGGRYLL
jgi:leucyl aminopeptidase (aminopeptidase T)